jgi:hypothetical protein
VLWGLCRFAVDIILDKWGKNSEDGKYRADFKVRIGTLFALGCELGVICCHDWSCALDGAA